MLLGLTAAASATDEAIRKTMFGSGTAILVYSNEDLNDINKILKSLKGSGILIKIVSKTNKNEAKQQRISFLSMFFRTLGAILIGNMLADKGVMRAGESTIRAEEGKIRTSQDFQCSLIL